MNKSVNVSVDNAVMDSITKLVLRDTYNEEIIHYTENVDEYGSAQPLEVEDVLVKKEDGSIELDLSDHKYLMFSIEYWLGWRLGLNVFFYGGVDYELKDIYPKYDQYTDYSYHDRRDESGVGKDSEYYSDEFYCWHHELIFKMAELITFKYLEEMGTNHKRCKYRDLLESGMHKGVFRFVPKINYKSGFSYLDWVAYLDVAATDTEPERTEVWKGGYEITAYSDLNSFRSNLPDYWIKVN